METALNADKLRPWGFCASRKFDCRFLASASDDIRRSKATP